MVEMSNRDIKLKLHQADPRCHWCERETKLTNIPELNGEADPLMATVDHLRSRYCLDRFVKPKIGAPTKVLACYECNSRRAQEETDTLSREELVKRSRGFSLNPRGKPIIVEGLSSLDEVIHIMREKLPDFEWYEKQLSCKSPGNEIGHNPSS
jgi:hypothetical protein